ncbi:shikimate dehydrogenase [Aeromicrobium sp. CTD01-1L150]|uniref:shikimate dehydrogenase n=1 Tax=Aeromicrobium sp. CTD01-1L150 TaxID=3341830 RepID=UPI0035C0E459
MSPTRRIHRLALVGSGIAGSLSPVLHTDEATALGLESFDYSLIDLEACGRDPREAGEVLHEAVDAGYTGFNVTHPCKQVVIDVLDVLDSRAEMLGAVNTVVVGPEALVGHNTDYTGFAAAMERSLRTVPRGTVVLTGAGGAGAAVAHALADGGVETLVVIDPDVERAGELAASVQTEHEGTRAWPGDLSEGADLLAGAAGLVNASPIGMHGYPGTPLPLSGLTSDHWVADIVYRPLETVLLREARVLGCRTMDGVDMLVGQAAEAFTLMTEIAPDPERMHRVLRRRLASRAGAEVRAV